MVRILVMGMLVKGLFGALREVDQEEDYNYAEHGPLEGDLDHP